MSGSKVLNSPRELSEEELQKIEEAQSKWYPKLLQSYDTTLYEMMADPVLKAIVHLCIFAIFLAIVLIVTKIYLGPKTKFFKNLKSYNGLLILLGILVFVVIMSFSTVRKQTKLNNNLVLVMTLTSPGATKYDYELNPVIRDQLMRGAVGRRQGNGSAFLGGLLGASLSSNSGSRRRR